MTQPNHNELSHTIQESAPRTCPDWCAEPDGHQFEPLPNGDTTRFHTTQPDQISGLPDNEAEITIEISAEEYKAQRQSVTDCDPLIDIMRAGQPEHISLTGNQARQMATSLDRAADLVDSFINQPRRDETVAARPASHRRMK
jgi:hypothetical protein